MAFRAIVTILVLSIAISAGNGAILQSLRDLVLKPFKPLTDLRNDSYLNFTELSGQYGFATEEHTVTTEDGYVLTVFRMKGKDCIVYKNSPVLVMHGLFQSGDSWLDAGQNAGLAYLIAEQCHDLWVGNQRGNYYGRNHVRLDPDEDAEFWEYSIDEMGIYDIPAMVDYVLENTGKEKLTYVGFSQSVGTAMIMCSERPGYCDKLNLLIALGPAARITNLKSLPLKTIFESSNYLKEVLSLAGVNEVFARGEVVQGFVSLLCMYRTTSRAICGTGIVNILDASYPGSIDDETLELIATHTPAGTSLQTLARYGQSLQTDEFQKFDYGKIKNIAVYGSEQPPLYNLTAVTAPVVVMYGRDDQVNVVEDVLWLVKKLPNVLEAAEVSEPRWNHLDMIYSQYINELIFPKINQYLTDYST